MPRLFLLPLTFVVLAAAIHGKSRAQPAAAPTAAPVAVEIQRLFLGSGEPEQGGYENATLVLNDVYHAPQYLPGLPTSAAIWPRVIDVPCTRLASGGLRCQGYNWTPAMGRAEYLYFRPVVVAGTPVGVERIESPVAVEPPAPMPVEPAAALGGGPAMPPAQDGD